MSNTLGQVAMAAGITLAAMAVHLGQSFASGYHAYHIAFGVLAVVALLPKGTGDHFIDRRSTRCYTSIPP